MQEKPYFVTRNAQGVNRVNRKVVSILIIGLSYDK